MDFRSADVFLLPKMGLLTEACNYRPFSLTSVPRKVLESIIKDRVADFLEINNLINTSQNGFRRGSSWVTNILDYIITCLVSVTVRGPWIQSFETSARPLIRSPISLWGSFAPSPSKAMLLPGLRTGWRDRGRGSLLTVWPLTGPLFSVVFFKGQFLGTSFLSSTIRTWTSASPAKTIPSKRLMLLIRNLWRSCKETLQPLENGPRIITNMNKYHVLQVGTIILCLVRK